MRPFAYERPTEIVATLGSLAGGARPLAGGTDLLTLMKGGIVAPDTLVDLKRVADLDAHIVTAPDGGVRIGALVTLSQVEHDPTIARQYPALAAAAAQAATPQLRNRATIGGNLLQRPRCWYFRESEVPCWQKGGDSCPAREGENSHHAIFTDDSPCVAVHPSDSVTALLALDATVHLRGADGDRDVPVADFLAAPTDDRRRENTLRPDELVTAVSLPAPAEGGSSVYLKAMDRKVWAFALVGVAASVTVSGGTISDVRIVLGGVANTPRRATAAEDLVRGQAPSDELFARAAEAALAGATPLAHNGYKVPLATELVRRALAEATAG